MTFYVDLDTNRFVQEKDKRLGLRSVSFLEGETYEGTITVIQNDIEVTADSLALELKDAYNVQILSEAVITNNEYTLEVAGIDLRDHLANRLNGNFLIVATVELNGEIYKINYLPCVVTANAEGNTSEGLLNNINAHKADKSNPHEVTAAQVGLGNVDNTADIDKPVSTATQTALDDLAADLEGQIPTGLPWDAISEKPSEFPPSAHSHPWGEITDKPAEFPPSAHSHQWADITDRPNTGEFATKVDLGATGENLINQIEGLTSIYYPLTGNPAGYLDINDQRLVKTSGNQTISGNKIFRGIVTARDLLFFGSLTINNLSDDGLSLGSPSNAEGKLFFYQTDEAQGRIGYDNTQSGYLRYLDMDKGQFTTGYSSLIVKNGFVTTIDFVNRQLSGDWITNTSPTLSQHIANKGYVDSAITTFGGNVVYVTGDQIISGEKRFSSLYANRITTTGSPGGGGSQYNGYVDVLENKLVRGGSLIIGPNYGTTLNWNTQQLLDSIYPTSGVSLDWRYRQLSGDWLTNTVPTLNQHIINKGYLQTGNFNLANVVRTTGNQTIAGTKSFTSTLNVGNIPILPYYISITPSIGAIAVSNSAGDQWGIDFSTLELKAKDSSFDFPTLNWGNRNLTGAAWTMNYAPTLSGHLTNKGYVDRLVTGGNIPNVVYTTGQQVIPGFKTFTSGINVTNIGAAAQAGGITIQPQIFLLNGVPGGAVGQLRINGVSRVDWINRQLSGTWTSENHNVNGTLGIGNGGATIVADAFSTTFNKDITTPFAVNAQLFIGRSNFGGEVRFIDEDASNLNKNISIYGNDTKLGISWQAGDYSAAREWFTASRGGLSDPEISFKARSFNIENTGGAVALVLSSNSVVNSTAITEHYGRTGAGVGSYARMGGTYAVAGSSYGIFSDTALNLLANNGIINLNGNLTVVRGNGHRFAFESFLSDKINLYSDTFGVGIAANEMRWYVDANPNTFFSFGNGTYNSFTETSRIWGSGSAEFKKVTTESGFLVNVQGSGLLPEPVFGVKNVTGLNYEFSVDENGNTIAASYATSQPSIQSLDESYTQFGGSVLVLPDDANIIRYSNIGNTAVSFNSVSGAANGCLFDFINDNPTGTVTFTHNSFIRVRGGSNLVLAPMEGCRIASLNSTGVTIY